MLVMLIQSVGSQPPPPHNHYLATTLAHPSLHAWTSPRMHPYHVTLMSALTVDEWEMTPWDLSSSSAPTTTTIFFNPCSMCLIWGCSPVVNTLTDYVDWKNIGCRVQCSLKKNDFTCEHKDVFCHKGCILPSLHHPFFHTHVLAPFFSIPFIFPSQLISECCLLFSLHSGEWMGW